jgi:hypothetical protein
VSEFSVVSAVSLPQQLKEESLRGVRAWDANRSRSKQTGAGASDLGGPCVRQLAYKATGAPRLRQASDPWAAIVGTACHAVPLHEAFLNNPDWLLDLKLEIGPGIWGTLDRYHVPTATIVDDKVLSADSMKKMRAQGPGPQYRTQVHCYGFGMSRLGHEVKNVALCCWPRSGRMVDAYVWAERYDEDVVEAAFVRWYGLKEASPAFTPEMFRLFAKADGPCGWCNYYDPELASTRPELACGGWKS